MTPTILVVGATGNTGTGVVHVLPELLKSSKSLSDYRIIATTRSYNSPAAKEIAQIPGVEVIEKDWPMIDADWLRARGVVRAFVASHNLPSQFAEESTLYTAMLDSGVKYVVRISTMTKNVTATTPVYYGRAHWAIENLLSQPEFKALAWTSLQPAGFKGLFLSSAAAWIKHYRQIGKQEPLKILLAADKASAMVDPFEIGVFAAHLLSKDDLSAHNHAKYIVNGPEDINGNQIVDLVEQHTGVRPETVLFKDVSRFDGMLQRGYSESAVRSSKLTPIPIWEGKADLASLPTSREVLELAPPKRTPAEALESLLESS